MGLHDGIEDRSPRRGSRALYQDTRGLWTAAVPLPPGPDGKRRRKVVRARIKAAASDKLKKLRAELDRTGDLPTSSPTLEQWMRTWLKTKSREMKPNRRVAYSGPVDRTSCRRSAGTDSTS